MNPAAASVGDLVQHAMVTAVALGALGVVLRRMFGVFGTRPVSPRSEGQATGAGPACSHCPSGNAAAKKPPHR